jgi:hypothetical protein
MICYIPGCICYGSENFGLRSQRVESIRLPGATPQLHSVTSYKFDYCFVDEKFILYRVMGFFPPINQLISFVFESVFFFFDDGFFPN